MATKVGIVGAAGFAGIELARIITKHPQFSLEVITSDANESQKLSDCYPAFAGTTDLAFSANREDVLDGCDVVFLAVPHTAAMALAPGLLAKGKTVIDLSADFRLRDASVYEAWYGVAHTALDELADAAFGLPELFPDDLVRVARKRASGEAVLVGCAGCYPTATSLAAAPAIRAGLVSDEGFIVADAVSGVTGAGKKATERTHFCFANENLEAYGVAKHRHTPEIEQILGISGRLVFTPHLAPLNRGLLSTVTLPISTDVAMPTVEELEQLYVLFYQDSPFVQVIEGGQPRTASVSGTNNAHIGLAVNAAARAIIATGAIDNLGKGAAGQAVQCANIVCGFDQCAGLDRNACAV